GSPSLGGGRRTPGSGLGRLGPGASAAGRRHRADTSTTGTGSPGPLRTRGNRAEPLPPPDSSAYWRTAGLVEQGSRTHRLSTWASTKSQNRDNDAASVQCGRRSSSQPARDSGSVLNLAAHFQARTHASYTARALRLWA